MTTMHKTPQLRSKASQIKFKISPNTGAYNALLRDESTNVYVKWRQKILSDLHRYSVYLGARKITPKPLLIRMHSVYERIEHNSQEDLCYHIHGIRCKISSKIVHISLKINKRNLE